MNTLNLIAGIATLAMMAVGIGRFIFKLGYAIGKQASTQQKRSTR